MPAPLSIIIPTLNAAAALPATANTLLEGVSSGVVRDLVMSDGGSTDETEAIAKDLGALWITGPAGRGAQLARGVAATDAPWLLLLHADTHLSPGWAETVFQHLSQHPDQAGWFTLRFRADGFAPRLVEAGANLRARGLGLPYGDQGLAISQELLSAVGGVPELPLMEDVALARALKGKLRRLPGTANTSAERYERDGWARRVIHNLGTLTRYKLGADPKALKKRYERAPGKP